MECKCCDEDLEDESGVSCSNCGDKVHKECACDLIGEPICLDCASKIKVPVYVIVSRREIVHIPLSVASNLDDEEYTQSIEAERHVDIAVVESAPVMSIKFRRI